MCPAWKKISTSVFAHTLLEKYYCSTCPNCPPERNELNWFTTYFNIGIIIGGPFFTTALTVVQPRYWLPACTMVWSLFVLFIYKAEDAKTVYILRYGMLLHSVIGSIIWPFQLFCRSFWIRCDARGILYRELCHSTLSCFMLMCCSYRLAAGIANQKSAVGLLSSCFPLLEARCSLDISNLACMNDSPWSNNNKKPPNSSDTLAWMGEWA